MSKLFFGNIPKNSKYISVIIAGGSGTRFWPWSRKDLPKQYLQLIKGSDRSLIQATSDRLAELDEDNSVLVVTGESQKDLAQGHLPNAAVLCEPMAKNTAPALGYAAIKVLAEVGDVPMICLPADHIIGNPNEMLSVFREASALVEKEDCLVTIGIEPTRPETGYGYIRRGEAKSELAYRVQSFVEKPDLDTAKSYLESGDYYWNSGMFVWKPSVLLAEIKQHLPELSKILEEIKDSFGEENEKELIEELFQKAPSISIDFGIMEKASNVVVFKGANFNWSDIGSWDSYADSLAETADDKGNITKSKDTILIDTENTLVASESGKTIACIGLSNLVVVDTDDALLICDKKDSQRIKEVTSIWEKKQSG